MNPKITIVNLVLILTVVSAKTFKIPFERKAVQSIQDVQPSVAVLTAINELYYVTNISIGTPPQIFTVGFSPAIDTSFVPSVNCETCVAQNYFDGNKSSTYENSNWTEGQAIVNPARTHVVGNICADTFNLGGYNIQQQVFVNVFKEKNYDFPMDGVISLALLNDSFIHNMVSQNLIEDPILGYFISKTSGEISFGKPDSNHFSGSLSYFNLTSASSWILALDNYTSNDGNINDVAMFDMSVQNIQIGPATTKSINEALGAQLQLDGSYTFDCDKLDQYPPFTFTFTGQSLTLLPQDYIQIKDNKCISYFVTSSFYIDGFFNIGQPFFRKFYTVFDFGNQRLGFANSK